MARSWSSTTSRRSPRSSSRYLERAGYETRVAADGPRALALAGDAAPRPGRARPDAARHRRPRGDAPAARATRPRSSVILLTAKGEADRPRDRAAPRRRRLRGQAVLARRARGARRRRAAPGRRLARARGADRVRRPRDRPGGPARDRRAARRSSSPSASTTCSLHLVRHPGQVFSRDQLMDAVWQYSFYSDTSTVTVHMRRLRAKIEAEPVGPALAPDGLGRGLPVPAVSARVRRSWRSPRRSAGLVIGLVYGAKDGALMALFLLACGGAGDRRRARRWRAGAARLGGCRASSPPGSALTVVLVALGVGAVALLMFLSRATTRSSWRCCWSSPAGSPRTRRSCWRRGVLDDIESVRDGVRAVGDGRRDVEIRTDADDEIAELAAAANLMAAQLAEREAERDAAETARRDLIAAVSHDLRTPLTSLRLLAEAIEDDVVDPATRRRYLEQMSTHIASLSRADRGPVRALAAGGGRHPVVARSRWRSTSWSRRRSRRCARRPTSATWRFAADVAGGLAPAQANPEKLQRVLFNLIQNAIRHTPADGSVTVRARSPTATRVEVEVADTGEGIAADDRDARVRAVLPRRRAERALGRRHRPRPHDLPRDRGGPRRRDLARRLSWRARACGSACRARRDPELTSSLDLTSASAREVLRRARAVPAGRVTCYGDLSPARPPACGSGAPACEDPSVPWHRIVRADGSLAKGRVSGDCWRRGGALRG